jgi:hypothetical protein
MSGGFGSMKHMADIIKQNRDLLKGNFFRERYKKGVKSKESKVQEGNLEEVNKRINSRLRVFGKREVVEKIVAALFLVFFVIAIWWGLTAFFRTRI